MQNQGYDYEANSRGCREFKLKRETVACGEAAVTARSTLLHGKRSPRHSRNKHAILRLWTTIMFHAPSEPQGPHRESMIDDPGGWVGDSHGGQGHYVARSLGRESLASAQTPDRQSELTSASAALSPAPEAGADFWTTSIQGSGRDVSSRTPQPRYARLLGLTDDRSQPLETRPSRF
ncbi:hypothetical protein VTN00DRAFT_6451 [Thermoascus crustaceus]|uniref:uncharacterized protein n=1 Tax=Thermoascus crustaceus TaxID=5088 RepID=UPI003743527A